MQVLHDEVRLCETRANVGREVHLLRRALDYVREELRLAHRERQQAASTRGIDGRDSQREIDVRVVQVMQHRLAEDRYGGDPLQEVCCEPSSIVARASSRAYQ